MKGTRDFFRQQHAIYKAGAAQDERRAAAADTGLRCDKCSAPPEVGTFAKLGGTHWRIMEHAVGIPGRKENRQARRCGMWRAREPGEEG
ncbi:MAG TPA: hypothetical protein VII08_10560 [Myxococcales bacterium]